MYAEARFSDALADPSDPIMWRRTATTDRSKNPVCASIASLTNAARLQKPAMSGHLVIQEDRLQSDLRVGGSLYICSSHTRRRPCATARQSAVQKMFRTCHSNKEQALLLQDRSRP